MRPAFLIAAATFALLAGCATPTQYRLDRKVEELCAVDGGIRVYETVTLPGSKFTASGLPNFFRPAQLEDALGPEFRFKYERKYLELGTEYGTKPSLIKTQYQIVRRKDEKLLGSFTYYMRWGGDFITLVEPSARKCPTGLNGHMLLKQVFKNGDSK